MDVWFVKIYAADSKNLIKKRTGKTRVHVRRAEPIVKALG